MKWLIDIQCFKKLVSRLFPFLFCWGVMNNISAQLHAVDFGCSYEMVAPAGFIFEYMRTNQPEKITPFLKYPDSTLISRISHFSDYYYNNYSHIEAFFSDTDFTDKFSFFGMDGPYFQIPDCGSVYRIVCQRGNGDKQIYFAVEVVLEPEGDKLRIGDMKFHKDTNLYSIEHLPLLVDQELSSRLPKHPVQNSEPLSLGKVLIGEEDIVDTIGIFFKVEKYRSVALVNKKMTIVTPWSDYIMNVWDDEIATIKTKHKYIMMNVKTGDVLQSFRKISGVSDGIFNCYDSSSVYLFRENGKALIDKPFDECSKFKNGFAVCKKDSLWEAINASGDIVFSETYDFVENIREGRFRVKVNGKYGFLDENGDMVIPAIYDNAVWFTNGRASVKIKGGGGWFQIDHDGNVIQ